MLQVSLFKKQAYRTIILYIQTDPKKTMEVEILKEAVEYGQSRKWIAHAPLLPKDGE